MVEETYDPSKITFSFVTAPCYDHIWVAALALNCTDAHLKAMGKVFLKELLVYFTMSCRGKRYEFSTMYDMHNPQK